MQHGSPTTSQIAIWIADARARTLSLVADLDDALLRVPLLDIINPLLWEIGHVAWFQERWVLRRDGAASVMDDADTLYDSAAVDHDLRWDLRLPSRQQTLDYLARTRDLTLARLQRRELTETERYFQLLTVFHEDMHGEAFLYTRQTLAYAPPPLEFAAGGNAGPLPGDVQIPGGTYPMGAQRDAGFAFDNEQWAHPVEVQPFRISRAPVTQAEYAAFVDDGGYTRRSLWDDAGWSWRQRAEANRPVYWRRDDGGWSQRVFDRWSALAPHRPMIHVNAFEAEAYCRWAGRRLPREVEWEVAAAAEPGTGSATLGPERRRYPWGDTPPSPQCASLDARLSGTVDVADCPDGDSAFGCRQMLGNVAEWTACAFGPFPGFEPGPYREYSEPWFGSHRVVRGGAWSARARMIHNGWRSYYTPDRRDVPVGFRTCAR